MEQQTCCAVHCVRVVRCVEKADQKKQKHKSGENSSDDQREIAFLFHNENPFLCRGRLPTTFRSRELMIESSRQSFTRIRGSILPYSRSTTKLMIIMRAAISTRMPEPRVIAVGDRSDQKIAHARNRKNLFQNNAVCYNICDCHAPEGQYRNQGVFQHMVIHNTACTVSAGIGGAHIVGIELREHRAAQHLTAMEQQRKCNGGRRCNKITDKTGKISEIGT